jgi:peptidoglycan/xylan/chitin deacetylase (PgdA/CDA1 family)
MMASSIAACASTGADRHAVVLVYHHVSDETPPSTSVTPARFEAHLDWLADNGFRIWALDRLLAAVLDGAEPVPEDVLAITFDDAYQSVFDEARPRLEARGWPYAVFVNTDAIDAGHAPYMDWATLRDLAGRGVGIGNHSAAHAHMSAPADGQSVDEWRAAVRDDLARSHARLVEETGVEPTIFAYPYGEDSAELADMVAKRYRYALVQRSGAVGPLTDAHAVPRFPMATGFSELDRLSLAAHSRPLPVRSTSVSRRGNRGDLDWLRLELEPNGVRTDALACFSGSGATLPLKRETESPLRIRIDVDGLGRAGRNKINCTAPASDGSGEFYWYSHQWLIEP